MFYKWNSTLCNPSRSIQVIVCIVCSFLWNNSISFSWWLLCQPKHSFFLCLWRLASPWVKTLRLVIWSSSLSDLGEDSPAPHLPLQDFGNSYCQRHENMCGNEFFKCWQKGTELNIGLGWTDQRGSTYQSFLIQRVAQAAVWLTENWT